MTEENELKMSPLCQTIERDGKSVRIDIYENGEGGWVLQAVDEFNSFYPMEVIATAEEVDQLIAKYPEEAFLLFPEDRKFPI
ncbi:hypothetical protein LCGC14_3011530, partial [marine sediment metagenome]